MNLKILMRDEDLNGNVHQQMHHISGIGKSTCCCSKRLKCSKDLIEKSTTLFHLQSLFARICVVKHSHRRTRIWMLFVYKIFKNFVERCFFIIAMIIVVFYDVAFLFSNLGPEQVIWESVDSLVLIFFKRYLWKLSQQNYLYWSFHYNPPMWFSVNLLR